MKRTTNKKVDRFSISRIMLLLASVVFDVDEDMIGIYF